MNDNQQKEETKEEEKEDQSQLNSQSEEEKVLQDLRLKVDSLEEKNLLFAAEIENERKAHAKEIEQTVKYTNKRIILKIIPLIENYKRALNFAKESKNKEAENFVTGFEMILSDLKDNLKSEGVKEYSPQPYKEIGNSKFCEVIDEVENNEYQSGTIIQVFQNGYFLYERLLSPAKVVISRNKNNNI